MTAGWTRTSNPASNRSYNVTVTLHHGETELWALPE